MSPNITESPEDVLLELAKQLDVNDLMSFLSVGSLIAAIGCRCIRELQCQKTLWLDALLRIRHVQNHPLPLCKEDAENLATLPLRQLQDTAWRANRLMNNLKSDSPRPVRVRSFSFEPPENGWIGFMLIPGANLAVSHTCGTVSCWDIITSKRVASLEVPHLRVETGVCVEIVGKALIGASVGWDIEHLAVITIEYSTRARISISHVISPAMDQPVQVELHSRFFLAPWIMHPDTPVQTNSPDFRLYWHDGDTHPDYLPHGGRLYAFHRGCLFTEGMVQSLPFFCGSDQQSDPLRPSPTVAIELPLPFPEASSLRELRQLGDIGEMALEKPYLFGADYGVFAVTSRHFQWEGRKRSILHFWPGREAQGGQLDIEHAHFFHSRDPIHRTAVGSSGTYVLILVQSEKHYSGQGDGYLGLVHFSLTPTPHATFRKLDIGEVSPLSYDQIHLDESLGVVLLADAGGTVTCISYV
ncbi:hypothetical protein B0H14DRAFT_2755836 [Mycena olivaceomarginata]|nr:hypothetical protein B0H14DRAFT_2755836 [Mycena olivaceomarginata]